MTPVGAAILESPPVQAYKPQDIQEEIIQGPPSNGRRYPVNHLSLFYPMYHLCDCPQFQSQSHVDRQEWLTILTLDIPFTPLDFNPIKAPVIAQSSGKPPTNHLLTPHNNIFYYIV